MLKENGNLDWRWFVRPGDIVFDVGANVGAKAGQFLERGARVVCVEPQPDCVQALQQRFRKDRRVTIIPKGLAEKPGALKLSICSESNTISTFSEEWKTGRFASYKWDKTIQVPVTTLDEVIAAHGVPAYCKIDVEGFELSVLNGLTRPVPLLSFEFAHEFMERAKACVNYLEKIGFRRFNFTRAENPAFVSPAWLEARALFDRLGEIGDPDLWGDIYAQHGENVAGTPPQAGAETGRVAVFFSKDRPLQLDAALRSLARHCQDAASVSIKVLYTASTSRLLSLYRRLTQEHPAVDFVREGDFKRDLQTLLREAESVLFVVDDTVFVRDFSFAEAADTLRRSPEVLGFSLRLGRNTTNCYSMNQPQKLPEFEAAEGGWLRYRWVEAEHDFGYPLELSSSIYRGAEMRSLLDALEFRNPNTLEDAMSRQAERFRQSQPFLACAGQSIAFSIPANKVQSVCENRAGGNAAFSAESLAALFQQGQRMRIDSLDGFVPTGCHQELELQTAPAAEPAPLVSIIIPCYKQARYLPEAVASVAAQTFTDWEIIIVNDGSPDDTSEVARALARKYASQRVRLLEKKNGGLAHARNAGIAAAGGAYILPLDADDKIAPTMLEKTVSLLESDPAIAVAYTDVAHFGVAEKVIQAADFDFKKLCRGNQLNYCALFRREAWEIAGGYNANMIWGYEDWDFWIGCGAAGLIARRIPEPLLLYRVKEMSMYTAALGHDGELRARIALNHPALYPAAELAEAQTVWSNPALPDPPGAPKVSVIVPTFNRPGRLEETLRSIAGQTLRDFEIIVVNDNGVDVAPVVARCGAGVEIVHLRHRANRGLAAARNTGLRHARGKYIAYLDDDDIFLPDHLQTLADFLDSTGHKAAYTDAWCAEEEMIDGRYQVVRREVRYSSDWDNDGILVKNLAPVLCFMHERRAGIAAGEFDESLTTHEDWEYWIRLSRVGAPVHVKQVTCEFRARQDGSTMTSGRRADFLRTIQMVYEKHRNLAAGNETVRARQKKFLKGLEDELGVSAKPASLGGLLGRLFGRGRA